MKKNTSIVVVLTFVIITFGTAFFYDEPVIIPSDINILTGKKWSGNLTYLDYQTNEETKISACVTVLKINGEENKFSFSMEFPKEPQANNEYTVTISNDGKVYDGEKVIEKTIYSNDSIQIKTESSGMDDDKESLFRHTYNISPNVFIMRKDVKYTGDSVFIKRNEYYFTR